MAADSSHYHPSTPPNIVKEPSALRGSKGSPFCDWRKGCALIRDHYPEKEVEAQQILSSSPHLAETLVRLGFPYSIETVDMARAIQEVRHFPPGRCSCTSRDKLVAVHGGIASA